MDVWALGVITYILLAGYQPFQQDPEPDLFRAIRGGAYNFDDAAWANVSKQAIDLIKRMLTVDDAKRITIAEMQTHEWLHMNDLNTDLSAAQEKIKKMIAKRRLKKVMKTTTAALRFKNMIGAVKGIF